MRQRARTAIALAAIVFGVVALILSGGFIRDLYRQLGEALIHSQSGHLQVAAAAFFAEGSRAPEKHRIAAPDKVKAQIAGVPGVKSVMGRLSFSGLLNNGRADLPIIGEGIEPDRESELSTSLALLAGRMMTGRDVRGAMVGEGLARSLRIKPGDFVTLLVSTIDGAMNTGEFEVTGVFRSFSKDYDERAVKIGLVAAQELLATRDVNLIVVLLESTPLTDAAYAATIKRVSAPGLAVKRWEEINDFYANTVALYERQFAVLRLIILFMVLLGVANAVNMSVFERLGEFGTMRALGNRGGFIVRLILSECALLGAAGAVIGVLAGAGFALLISAIGIAMPPPPNSNAGFTARVIIEPEILAGSAAVGWAAAFLSGLVPALRARKTAIVEALRTAV